MGLEYIQIKIEYLYLNRTSLIIIFNSTEMTFNKLKIQNEESLSAMEESVQNQLTQQKNKHESDIYDMKTDYESKMQRLQRQNSKTQQRTQSSGNQDIFRKVCGQYCL